MSDYVHIREVVQPVDSLQVKIWEFYEQKILVYEKVSGDYQPIAEDDFLRWEIFQQAFVQQTNLILGKELSSDQNRLLTEDFFSHNKEFPKKPLIPSKHALLAYDSELNAQLDELLNSVSPQNSGATFLKDTHLLKVFREMLERRLREDLEMIPYFVSSGRSIPNWFLKSEDFQKWKDIKIIQRFPPKPGNPIEIKYRHLIQNIDNDEVKFENNLICILKKCREGNIQLFVDRENLNGNLFSNYQKIFDLGERSDPSLQLYQATHEWITSRLVEKDWNSNKQIIRLPTLRKEIIFHNGLLKFQIDLLDQNSIRWVAPQDLLVIANLRKIEAPPDIDIVQNQMLTIPQKRQERSKSVKRRPLRPHTFFIERQIFEGIKDPHVAWRNLLGLRGKTWIEEGIDYEINILSGSKRIKICSTDETDETSYPLNYRAFYQAFRLYLKKTATP